jgi:hypothetical protein
MKSRIFRALIEMGFIIFLFYANLFMGEFEKSNGVKKSLIWALEDIFTVTNLAIALVAACVGHLVFEFLRKKF